MTIILIGGRSPKVVHSHPSTLSFSFANRHPNLRYPTNEAHVMGTFTAPPSLQNLWLLVRVAPSVRDPHSQISSPAASSQISDSNQVPSKSISSLSISPSPLTYIFTVAKAHPSPPTTGSHLQAQLLHEPVLASPGASISDRNEEVLAGVRSNFTSVRLEETVAVDSGKVQLSNTLSTGLNPDEPLVLEIAQVYKTESQIPSHHSTLATEVCMEFEDICKILPVLEHQSPSGRGNLGGVASLMKGEIGEKDLSPIVKRAQNFEFHVLVDYFSQQPWPQP
ncbi:hypothetical protein L484_025927 [Morus notabilis]|uniref:Uncharacterized protein n=1 Tax=Morus notabilis TaxID=981085 RepID=W9R7E5_9ROSA|nr:hypothetical protein L484_025927 [Morus notabilis]